MPKMETSKFFEDNRQAVKSLNVTDLEVSPFFQKLTKNSSKLKKNRHFESEFRGFSKKEQSESAFRLNEGFSGFSPVECNTSSKICQKIEKLIKYSALNENSFEGFTSQEKTYSQAVKSKLLKSYQQVKTEIFKNIDRRILKNYTKDNEKIIYSKYWWQDTNMPLKLENKTWEDVENNEFLTNETMKIHNPLDRENVLISQIQRLIEELKEIRKEKYANSEKVKVQNSSFIQVKKELIMAQFVPPKSPHHLIEEELYHNPWALLVSTIFLNKTSCLSARPYVFWFLDENPDPLTVIERKVEELETYFGVLGLQKTRAVQVWKMSHDFLYKNWTKVSELYGIGRYAEDAFKMFCLGDFSVEPQDRFLRIYKKWYEMQEKESRITEMNG